MNAQTKADQNEPQLHFVPCWCLASETLHRMAYWEWPCQSGNAAAPVLLCVHGLTRQGRDFDALAQRLSRHYRVICPDIAGRGQSDWLAEPMAYNNLQYSSDLVTLMARLNVEELDWLGTSMGALIGIVVASRAGKRVRRLVLNDAGPVVPPAALQRLKGFVGVTQRFASEQEGMDYLISVSRGFGAHTPEQWRALSRPMLRAEDGGFVLHYDPKIALVLQAANEQAMGLGEALLWRCYDRISARTLLLRGALSDLLLREAAEAMTQRGPKAQLQEIAGVGHAPALQSDAQIDVVERFLLAA